jgi:rubrerythrin
MFQMLKVSRRRSRPEAIETRVFGRTATGKTMTATKERRRVNMGEDKTVKILKSAILLEKRGRAFYTTVAQQSDSDAVRQFFVQMADEEKNHIRVLSEQYKVYCETKHFKSGTYGTESAGAIASQVLTRDLKNQVSAAGFESAAIAAAMAMEKNAIALYSQRAQEAKDPNEKSLYEWLSDWEQTHLALLVGIEREITEKIWNDNNFWPF